MKVAALPRIYMKRCSKMACKSPVTSHSRLFIPTFKLQGSGAVCSIPTLNRKSIATKKTLLKESFLLLVIGCSGGSLSVLWEISNLRGASDFMRRTTPALPIEPAEPLSKTSKGRHIPQANPQSRNERLEIRDWQPGKHALLRHDPSSVRLP